MQPLYENILKDLLLIHNDALHLGKKKLSKDEVIELIKKYINDADLIGKAFDFIKAELKNRGVKVTEGMESFDDYLSEARLTRGDTKEIKTALTNCVVVTSDILNALNYYIKDVGSGIDKNLNKSALIKEIAKMKMDLDAIYNTVKKSDVITSLDGQSKGKDVETSHGQDGQRLTY